MITKYPQTMIKLSDFSKLSSPSLTGWINSILILMHNDD